MVPKLVQLPVTSLKHRGLFSYSALLKAIHAWFEENDYDFFEPKHKYKVPSPAGAEQEIDIVGERNITEYLRYRIKIYMHIWDMKEVEIIVKGDKRKMNEATVLIEVSGEYWLDYANRFRGNKFLQHLQDFYHKYIIRKTIDDWWEDNLFFKYQALVRTIKQNLQFEELRAVA